MENRVLGFFFFFFLGFGFRLRLRILDGFYWDFFFFV